MQSEEEMFTTNSDSPEEEEDEEDTDEYVQTLSPGYAVAAAAAKSVCDSDTGDDDFPYEVLTAEQLVQYMVDCIKDVNTVVQVCCSYHSC